MTELIIILVCLVFSAFFSGMEIAFISSNKLRIEVEKKQEKRPSAIISIFIKNPGQYIATMLVGNNIALVIYGIFMAIILQPVISIVTSREWAIILCQTIISTLIILVTAEFLPKTLFRINPNKALNAFAFPVMFFYLVLYPVAWFTVMLTNTILSRFFSVDTRKRENIVFGKVDIDNFLNEMQNHHGQDQKVGLDVKIFQNALDFSNIKLRECIVPRTEIVAHEVNDSLENLKTKFIETGMSKILVYKDNIDNIIGCFHVSELFKNPKSLRSKIIPVSIVPETMPANRLLELFIQEHKSIAVVVDEFGGTSGMVTIEDIMEEIFGEIEDEHDMLELAERKISDHEYILSGRIEIDYLNEKYDLNLPESEDYETIAGLILYHHNNLPDNSEEIQIENFRFVILNVSNTRIELVKLKISE
ncbi:MAG: hemolysin family protein [Bacteroidetes bacterium]|nr:hemolysin family protein [Bacteroidota bacterium]